MKKVILYAVMASIIWCNYACNQDNIPVIEDDQPSDNPIGLTAAKQAEKVEEAGLILNRRQRYFIAERV